MLRLLLIAGLIAGLASGAQAQDCKCGDGKYETERDAKVLSVLLKHNSRIQELEKKTTYIQASEVGTLQKFAMRDMKRIDDLQEALAKLSVRVTELESELQRTRDQAARILRKKQNKS